MMTRTGSTLGVLISAAALVAACSAPGSSTNAKSPTKTETVSSPVSVADVAKLGDITLHIVNDAGEKDTLAALVPAFEKKYPNVTVKSDTRSYDDLVKTAVNTMNQPDPPDLIQGAQGYTVDGTLVKTGLIRPLDDIAKTYSWNTTFGQETFNELRWTSDGQSFGSGALYGVTPVVSMVGVYYNKSKLAALGLHPPKTAAEFTRTLSKIKAAGEQPMVLGNSNQTPGLHAYGLVQGEYAKAQDVRDWISGSEGATFVTDANEQAAKTLQDWARAGYFGRGFNGISEDDGVSRFASGRGVFLMGGTWNMPTILQSGGSDFGYMAMPPGPSRKYVATGSLGLGWHISSKSEHLPAAVAFLAMLHSTQFRQQLADVGRLPIVTAKVSPPSDLFSEAANGTSKVLDDTGETYSFDWATDTMLGTMGGAIQELMDGRITPHQFCTQIQDNWEKFQQGRG